MSQHSLNHSFNVSLAEEHGIDCAIVIHHFQFWIGQNQKIGRNFHEGRTWMFQTHKEISAIYPYWSEDAVYRIIKKLLEKGIIIKGNFNKSPLDNTAWYAFKDEKMFTTPRNRGIAEKDPEKESVKKTTSQGGLDDSAKSRNANREIAVCIPDTKSQDPNKIDIKTMSFDIQNDDFVLPVDITSLAKRFCLNADQQNSLIWLVNQKIDTHPDTLCYWSREYSLKRLQDVYNLTKKKKRVSVGAYMNKLLKINATVENDNSKLCHQFAIDYTQSNQWPALQIFQQYVKLPLANGSYIELPYTVNHIEFAKKLMDIHLNHG